MAKLQEEHLDVYNHFCNGLHVGFGLDYLLT